VAATRYLTTRTCGVGKYYVGQKPWAKVEPLDTAGHCVYDWPTAPMYQLDSGLCGKLLNFTRLRRAGWAGRQGDHHLSRWLPRVSPYNALVSAAAAASQLLQLLDTLHLALSTAPTPCLPLEWPVSVANCNNATTRNVQAVVASDIRASRLLFITAAVLPGTLTVPGRSFWQACCTAFVFIAFGCSLNLLSEETIDYGDRSVSISFMITFSWDLSTYHKHCSHYLL